MSLDCARTEERLSDFLDGSLDDGEREGIAAHLARCASCRSALEGLSTTIAALRTVPREKAPPELLAGVNRMIAAEEAAVPSRPPAPASRRSVLWPSIGAVAAAFLAVLTYGVFRESARTNVPGAPAPSPRVESSPAETSAPASVAPPPAAKKAAGARAPRASAAGTGSGPSTGRGTEARRTESSRARRDAAPPLEAAAPSGGAHTRAKDAGTSDRVAVAPPPAAPVYPAAPVSRVSTEGGILRSPSWPPGPAEEAPPRLFASPAARMSHRPMPVREIVLVVAADRREGVEGKVRECAARRGGKPVGEPVPPGSSESVPAIRAAGAETAASAKAAPSAGASTGKTTNGTEERAAGTAAEGARREALRFLLPASAADAFAADLSAVGIVLGEGTLRAGDVPPDMPHGIVTVTVTIRVR